MPPASSSERTERGFLRLLQFASTVSLGGMAGFLYSVKEVNPHVEADFGFGTACAFVLMGGATWLFWRVLLARHHLDGATRTDRRVRALSLIALSLIVIGGMIAATLRALRNLPHDRYADVVEGTVMALAVLGVLGGVFWRLVRFLQEDHERTLNEQGKHRDE